MILANHRHLIKKKISIRIDHKLYIKKKSFFGLNYYRHQIFLKKKVRSNTNNKFYKSVDKANHYIFKAQPDL